MLVRDANWNLLFGRILFLGWMLLGWGLPLAKAQYTWDPLPAAPIAWRLDDMYFLNARQGWAINPYYSTLSPNLYGRVMGTQDGGQTWQVLLDSSETYIRSIGFADSLHGWFGNLGATGLAVDTNFLYQTSDGGHQWSPVTQVTGPRPKGVCGISVTSDSTIYGYGRYYGSPIVLKTTDQGASWNSQSLDSLAAGLVDAWFFGSDTGFVIGSVGQPKRARIISTFDGGATWQVRHTSTRDDETGWKIFFPSRLVGYVAVEGYLERLGPSQPLTNYISKTTDGGLTWTDKVVSSTAFYQLQGIGFINDSVGWVGGDCCSGWSYKTTNGGNSWLVDANFGVTTPPYDQFGGFAMNRFRKVNDTLMYASGNTVYRLSVNQSVGAMAARPAQSWYLSPNPARGQQLLFTADMDLSGEWLEMFDLQGRPVMPPLRLTGGQQRVEIPHLAAGLYVYGVRGAGKKRLLIEH